MNFQLSTPRRGEPRGRGGAPRAPTADRCRDRSAARPPPARAAAARATTTSTNGRVTAETRRLIGVGHVGPAQRAPAQRLDDARQRDRLGPADLLEEKARAVRQAGAERDTRLPIPRAQQRFAEPLTLPLGDDQRIGRPGALGIEPANADAHRHERTRRNHRRTFAHDPVGRLAGLVRGVAPCPVPAKTNGVRRLSAERPSIQLLDAAPIVGAIAVRCQAWARDLRAASGCHRLAFGMGVDGTPAARITAAPWGSLPWTGCGGGI